MANKSRSLHAVSAVLIAATALVLLPVRSAAASAGASTGGAWTPDTGVVDFSRAHDDDDIGWFRLAVALVTFGYDHQGIRQLRRVVRSYPDAGWIDRAHYHLGLACFRIGRYADAYSHLEQFVAAGPPHGARQTAQRLQLQCAIRTGRRDVETAHQMLESLADNAYDDDLAAECRWTLAGLYNERRRFRDAINAYTEFVDLFPDHDNVPEAWFRVAAALYEIALRVDRGLQHFMEAEAALNVFLSTFPGHDHAGKAVAMLDDIIDRKSRRASEIAMYFLEIKDNPHASLDYLRDIERRFPDSEAAQQARERINTLEQHREYPRAGGYIPMPLDGVAPAAPSR